VSSNLRTFFVDCLNSDGHDPAATPQEKKFTPGKPHNNPMNKTSVRQSAFFNPRALLGFGFGALGLLLGLAAFIVLPKQSAWATPSPCTSVAYSESSGPVRDSVYVSMESHHAGTMTQCTIYYTVDSVLPPDPTHSSAVYTGPYAVFHGQPRYFKAFGHALLANPEDSPITSWYSAP
jgi:hypothetical protein